MSLIEQIKLKFKSGNHIPVERSTLTRQEADDIIEELKQHKKVVEAADILAMNYTDLMCGNVDGVRFKYSEAREALPQLGGKE